MIPDEEMISKLDHLTGISEERSGYLSAAAHELKSPVLKKACERFGQQAVEMTQELRAEASRLRAAMQVSETPSPMGRQATIGEFTAGREDKEILQEIDEREDRAMNAYRTVLEADLSRDVQSVLERHYQLVKEARYSISALERRAEVPLEAGGETGRVERAGSYYGTGEGAGTIEEE